MSSSPLLQLLVLNSGVADWGKNLDVSAFIVIIWFAYRGVSVFKLSAVARTIVTEGTIYFLAMLAVQIYIQLSFVLIKVLPLSLGSLTAS